MKKFILNTTLRTLTGRKVKKLRKSGIIPATIYGKSIKSVSISCSQDEFLNLYKEAGETSVIDLTINDEKSKTPRPVLIHHVQKHPVDNSVLHIEFHQVDLKQKVTASIPLLIEGESPAVTDKLGTLLTLIQNVEVEALPTNLPEHIVVDISRLAKEGDEIKVADLKIPKEVTLTTDGSIAVIRIAPLVVVEEPVLVAEPVAAEEEKPTEEPTATKEEETKSEEKKQ